MISKLFFGIKQLRATKVFRNQAYLLPNTLSTLLIYSRQMRIWVSQLSVYFVGDFIKNLFEEGDVKPRHHTFFSIKQHNIPDVYKNA